MSYFEGVNSTMAKLAEEDENAILSLTEGQMKATAIASMVSGILSMLGSSIIVRMVIKAKDKTPYKRILFGLSICDIISSITYVVRVFLLPSETSQRVWAYGNQTTCTILGFFAQFSFSTSWYNCMLSFYFLLTVRFGMKQKRFGARIEPFMHVFVITFSLLTSIIGSLKDMYSEHALEQGCWFSPEYHKFAWIVGGLPLLLSLLCIGINNFIIYLHVRRTIANASTHLMNNNNNKNQVERTRAVATQAALYVATYFAAYLCSFCVRIITRYKGFQAKDANRIYILLFLSSLLLPMQGLFNVFVYTRPIYIRHRKRFPEESKASTLFKIWFGDGTERATMRSNINSNSHLLSAGGSSFFHRPGFLQKGLTAIFRNVETEKGIMPSSSAESRHDSSDKHTYKRNDNNDNTPSIESQISVKDTSFFDEPINTDKI